VEEEKNNNNDPNAYAQVDSVHGVVFFPIYGHIRQGI
jgi:hypothetical protein